MKKNIYFSSDFLMDEYLTSVDVIVMVYLIAYYNFKKGVNVTYLFIPGLYEQIFNAPFNSLTPVQKTTFRKRIRISLQKLMDEDYIKFAKREEKDFYIIEYIDSKRNGSFVMFDLADVDLILRETGSFILAHYYISLLKSRNYSLIYLGKRGAVGHMPLGFFAKIFNKTTQTIAKYNKQLEDLGIIYIRHSIAKGVSNAYGLMEDKERVNAYFSQFSKHDKSKTVNRKRSLKQKYNAIVENDDVNYDVATMEEIEEYVKKQEEIFKNKNFCN